MTAYCDFPLTITKCLRRGRIRAGEVAQLVGALAVLPGDLGLVPMVVYKRL